MMGRHSGRQHQTGKKLFIYIIYGIYCTFAIQEQIRRAGPTLNVSAYTAPSQPQWRSVSGALRRTPGNPCDRQNAACAALWICSSLSQVYWQERKYRVHNGDNASFHGIFVQVHSTSVALSRSSQLYTTTMTRLTAFWACVKTRRQSIIISARDL